MANQLKDIVKADPIDTLERSSRISLQGGGALLFAAILAVYMMNKENWEVSLWVILVALIGAILLGLASATARMYDAHLRVKLTLRLIEVKGTPDAEEAAAKPAINTISWDQLQEVLGGQLVMYAVNPTTVQREV
ncbi:MAG: hypothetical protein V4678_00625 [Patescibacteria group bacterium]